MVYRPRAFTGYRRQSARAAQLCEDVLDKSSPLARLNGLGTMTICTPCPHCRLALRSCACSSSTTTPSCASCCPNISPPRGMRSSASIPGVSAIERALAGRSRDRRARRDAAGSQGLRGAAAGARAVAAADPDADGARRRTGPDPRPRDGRRRLPAQAVQSARAQRAHRRGPAPVATAGVDRAARRRSVQCRRRLGRQGRAGGAARRSRRST